MHITSPAFLNNTKLPKQFAKSGANEIPPLEFADVPGGAESLAIILHDPDAPGKNGFYHWTIWNIPPKIKALEQNNLPTASTKGTTSWGRPGYNGAQPPFGRHRYIFYLHALDTKLDLPPGASVAELQAAMKGHILETATLTGLFSALDNFRK